MLLGYRPLPLREPELYASTSLDFQNLFANGSQVSQVFLRMGYMGHLGPEHQRRVGAAESAFGCHCTATTSEFSPQRPPAPKRIVSSLSASENMTLAV